MQYKEVVEAVWDRNIAFPLRYDRFYSIEIKKRKRQQNLPFPFCD